MLGYSGDRVKKSEGRSEYQIDVSSWAIVESSESREDAEDKR